MVIINIFLFLLVNLATNTILWKRTNAQEMVVNELSFADKLLNPLNNQTKQTRRTRHEQSEAILSQENQQETLTSIKHIKSWPRKRLQRSLITRNNASSISEHQQNKCRIWIP